MLLDLWLARPSPLGLDSEPISPVQSSVSVPAQKWTPNQPVFARVPQRPTTRIPGLRNVPENYPSRKTSFEEAVASRRTDVTKRKDAIARRASSSSITGSIPADSPVLKLDGKHIELDDLVRAARNGGGVHVAAESMSAVERGFRLTLEAAVQARPVYGLTVGTGWNKDQKVFSMLNGKPVLDGELLASSEAFNLRSIRAHSAGVGNPMPLEIVRAGMMIRLHTMLNGNCGVQPQVVRCLSELINNGIVPVVPDTGTVGEADPLLASHIGLVMCGEWQVFKNGTRMEAARALAEAGIEPVKLVGKDFLSILSTNALTAGSAVVGVHDAEAFLAKQVVVFSMCLEALNGNISPFLKTVANARPFPDMQHAAAAIRRTLQGSALWEPSDARALQDPISYRAMAYYLGDCERGLGDAKRALSIQVNHSDDNPYIAIDRRPSSPISEQEERYLVNYDDQRGAIYPTAHFESLPFISPIEQLLSALGKLSNAVTNNIVRLECPDMTHLPRFLAARESDGHAFGGIQKVAVALNDKNRMLTMPAQFSGVAVAGRMEDVGTTSGIAVDNLHKVVDNLYSLASLQLLHAAQGVDLRSGFTLSEKTRALHDAYRKRVPFVKEDRVFTTDIEEGRKFLKQWKPEN